MQLFATTNGEQTTIDPQQLRNVLGQMAKGVTVVTTMHLGHNFGMTVSSFASVSLEPPLVLVCLNKRAQTHQMVIESGHFAVNILRAGHQEISDRFAGRQPEVQDRFANLNWTTKATGAPILTDCQGWLDCRTYACHEGGDHTIFLGEVVACDLAKPGGLLLYYAGNYRTLLPVDSVASAN